MIPLLTEEVLGTLTALLMGGRGSGQTSLSLVKGRFFFGNAFLVGALIGKISRDEKSDSSLVNVKSASSLSLVCSVHLVVLSCWTEGRGWGSARVHALCGLSWWISGGCGNLDALVVLVARSPARVPGSLQRSP